MTPRQQKFVAEFALSGNGAAAARAAGYAAGSSRVASAKLLAKGSVQAALEAERATLAARMDIDRQRVIDGLLEAIEQARADRNSAAMIRGWSEIGRMCGFYAPEKHAVAVERVDVTTAVIERRLNSLSDAELVRLIETGWTPAATRA
ncbi:MAG: terminase small subunit [Burkholderiaceae bacterium]